MQLQLLCLADAWDDEMSVCNHSKQSLSVDSHATKGAASEQRPLSDVLQWLEKVTVAANHEQWMWVAPAVAHLRDTCLYLADCDLAVTPVQCSGTLHRACPPHESGC